MRTRRTLGKGFTLIELLVVILILAILAALIVPRVVNRSDDAKIATATADRPCWGWATTSPNSC